MAESPKKISALRIIVPVLLLLLGVLIMWSVVQSARQAQRTPQQPVPGAPAQATPAAAPAAPTPPVQPPATADGTREQPGLTAPPDAPAAAAPLPGFNGLRMRVLDSPPAPDELGSLDPASGYQMRVRFNPLGAGIESIELTQHFQTVARIDHDVVQETQRYTVLGQDGAAVPLAAGTLRVDDVLLNLADATVWEQTEPGRFEAVVEDLDGTPVLRIVRHYQLRQDEYFLTVQQRVQNLSDRELTLQWYQYGPVSLPRGKVGYGGDARRVRFGYLRSPAVDPAQQHVQAGRYILNHDSVLGRVVDRDRNIWPERTLWPDKYVSENQLTLVWTAVTNRYFAVAMFPLIDAAAGAPDKAFHDVGVVNRFVYPRGIAPGGKFDDGLILQTVSPEARVSAGGALDLSHGLYAGPLSRRYTQLDPMTQRLGLGELVVFTFGGPCAFCTFQSLAYGLYAFLATLHDYVVFDWALAIIFLVVCVRTLLHPVTRWSQTSMYRFGKQMQGLAPKQRKLQEKYKNEPQKMREEMARLIREENINYAGALGCIPMFLQMPIWIALFAMLYFAFDLRHTPAFFGVFQAISAGQWSFLADLAEPDRFIALPISLYIPWISAFMGPIEGINILPLVLGVVFYLQQKYLTPQTSGTLTPEQEAQQKMIKIMMVVMFPVIMYNAPSGLALYFITNSALGILESKHIRHKAEEADKRKAELIAAGVGTSMIDRKDKPSKPGFFARLQQYAEQRQKMMEQMKAEQARRMKGKGGGGPGRGKGR